MIKNLKKLVVVFALLICVVCTGTSVFSVSAESLESFATADDWMPLQYLSGGSEVPTEMICNPDGTLAFTGKKNGSYGNTGFILRKPVDVTNFSIDLDLVIPDIDHLMWISMAFLDKDLAMDTENTYGNVAMPFNAFAGLDGYHNSIQNGAVIQMYTHKNAGDWPEDANTNFKDNGTAKIVFAEKTLDCCGDKVLAPRDLTGEQDDNREQTFHELRNSLQRYVKLTDDTYKYNERGFKFKFEMQAGTGDKEGGIKLNIADGNWNYYTGNGQYNGTDWPILNSEKFAGFVNYFKDRPCYFSFVVKYDQDFDDRQITINLNSINGKKPSDGNDPTYIDDVTLEQDAISMDITKDMISAYGLYPKDVTGLEIKKYDDEDDYYSIIKKKATSQKLELIDYFSVWPTVGTRSLSYRESALITYALPEDYGDFKIYYVNEEETLELMEDADISDGYATFEVNDTVNKIIIYGKQGAGAGGSSAGSCTCGGLACNGSIDGSILIYPLCIAGATLFIRIRKRKK